MDLLSRFLSLTPVNGRIDERCHFGSPWVVEVGAAGVHEIPYHVLLAGEAVLEDGNGPPRRLTAGDVILFPTGAAHRIHDGSGVAPGPAVKRRNITLTVVENGGSGPAADLLCGRFLVGAMPDRLLRDHLPARLVVSTGRVTDRASLGNGASAALDAARDEAAGATRIADVANDTGGRAGHADHADHPDAANANGDARSSTQQPTVAGSRLARIVALMREEAFDESPGSECLINYLSAALFALTLRFASEGADAPRGLLALAGQPRLQPALSAMFEEPGKPWTLDQFASLCHMSRATFVRQFQDAIGRSATDMLTEVRLTIAGRALLETLESVAEIGASVGYQSEAAFQRVFKRHIGVTPARWRATGGNAHAK
ncbi:AraC family transcriptional regulator [Paraburkholderia rhizosphaerae]|uniref:AraC family transcriptional activator of mtrCDE n=1 Tax=Paraburkholderia rhizosphaerae TaxID=480658 RepID=A0A4R8LV78_9BURK|nr:AraC family transcriptional regulator [Paraburkholderia rhizosphaerae]TDY51634.1 AraC family transcriptional activator of mtrCDE [Paraburkholderia rhizosphaerae]